ncbi:glycerol-3-phosphate dehydrogenase [Actinomyces denticolens]|nr:glycerol-3-phosphate dehydrogenase [Actinomyces denticolens]
MASACPIPSRDRARARGVSPRRIPSREPIPRRPGGDRPREAYPRRHHRLGAWGTAFASLVAEAGGSATIWARRAEVAEEINTGANERYLPGLRLPAGVRATTDMSAAASGAEMVVVAVPSQAARGIVAPLAGRLEEGAAVVSLMKGIELGTGMRMSEVMGQALDAGPERLAVVSGPNLADEIAARQPTATVIAAADEDLAARVAAACATAAFRPYTNTDVLGVELCGAVKNVIALAVGMAAGRGYGDNSKATIITRAWWRSPAWAWPWARAPRPSRAWPGWETSWPPAPRP